MEKSDELIKIEFTKLSFLCIFPVDMVVTFDMYRNQLPVNFILHIESSIRHEIHTLENIFSSVIKSI